MTETHEDAVAATDLKSIGDILKAKREELSYTLEHVSEVTRISLTCLKNVEEGNLDQLPGLVFTRGFIRNYASMLNLESDWMIEALNKTYADQTEAPSSITNEIYALGQKKEKSTTSNLGPISFVFLILIILIASVWYWQSGTEGTATISEKDTIEAVSETVPSTVVAQEPTPEETAITPKEEIEPKPEIKISPMDLVLIGKREEWVQLVVDDKKPIKIRLTKGKRYEWPAEEKYALTMTTGVSASVYLNGEEIEISENVSDKLYQIQLNKFSLTRLNN